MFGFAGTAYVSDNIGYSFLGNDTGNNTASTLKVQQIKAQYSSNAVTISYQPYSMINSTLASTYSPAQGICNSSSWSYFYIFFG